MRLKMDKRVLWQSIRGAIEKDFPGQSKEWHDSETDRIYDYIMKVEDETLGDIEEAILSELYSNEEMCYNYSGLEYRTKYTRKELEPAIKFLRTNGYIEHWNGLMDDDGRAAGSGWCRSEKGNEYVEEHAL